MTGWVGHRGCMYCTHTHAFMLLQRAFIKLYKRQSHCISEVSTLPGVHERRALAELCRRKGVEQPEGNIQGPKPNLSTLCHFRGGHAQSMHDDKHPRSCFKTASEKALISIQGWNWEHELKKTNMALHRVGKLRTRWQTVMESSLAWILSMKLTSIYLLKAYSPVNRTGSPQGFKREELYLFIYLLKAYSPVNRTGSPQGFSQIQILHMSHKKTFETHKRLKRTLFNQD